MTTTAALAAKTIDLDGYTLKITERTYSGRTESYVPDDRSWRIDTKGRTFDYEITRDDGNVVDVNSARSIKEIYAAAGSRLRGAGHTVTATKAPKVKVGDRVIARPHNERRGGSAQVVARHPVPGLLWVASEYDGSLYAVRAHRVQQVSAWVKPTRKALAEQESLAINV